MSSAVTSDDQRDHKLKVWILDMGPVLTTLEGHTRSVSSCAITPDGQRVVSASGDRTLKIWDLDTGRVLVTLEGHTGWVSSCAVTPDGRYVVSASYDKTLKVWDLMTHRCLATHRGDTRFTAVAATTTTICAGDDAGTLWFLDWPPSLRPLPLASPQPVLTPHAEPSILSGATTAVTVHTPRARVPRNVILFLAANPSGTSRLALEEECAAIKHELRMTAHRDDFEFRSEWAVTVDEMRGTSSSGSPPSSTSVATVLVVSPRQHTGPRRHGTSFC